MIGGLQASDGGPIKTLLTSPIDQLSLRVARLHQKVNSRPVELLLAALGFQYTRRR